MNKTGIFYGRMGGSTEKVAKKIHKHLPEAQLHSVPENGVKEMLQYDNLILGIATLGQETWGQDTKKSGWDAIIAEVKKANFEGKTVAIFGLGDSVTYDLHFVDSIGTIARIMRENGAKLIGFTDTKDYSFRESKAIENDKFMGLPIDEDFEEDKTDQRIKKWIDEIKNKM